MRLSMQRESIWVQSRFRVLERLCQDHAKDSGASCPSETRASNSSGETLLSPAQSACRIPPKTVC